jgi:hypothetical protein
MSKVPIRWIRKRIQPPTEVKLEETPTPHDEDLPSQELDISFKSDEIEPPEELKEVKTVSPEEMDPFRIPLKKSEEHIEEEKIGVVPKREEKKPRLKKVLFQESLEQDDDESEAIYDYRLEITQKLKDKYPTADNNQIITWGRFATNKMLYEVSYDEESENVIKSVIDF